MEYDTNRHKYCIEEDELFQKELVIESEKNKV